MLRLLPILLIPVLVFAGLMYWRFQAAKPTLHSSKSATEESVEVPSTLPGASLEDRVKVLEETLVKLVAQVNNIKSSANSSQTTTASSDSKLTDLEGAIIGLKNRVSTLEKASPAPAAPTSKSVVYIPLGSGGGPWANIDWYTTSEYEITLDPEKFPGYTGMILEVTFRLIETAGTGSVRLYNVSDSSAISSQLDTALSSFALKSSSSFTLPSGSKTYKLQVKSSSNKDLFIQSARIKVNF